MVNLKIPTPGKPAATQPSTSRQQLLRQPWQQEEDKWYAGDVPTNSETLARIYTISQKDLQKGQQLWDAYHAQTANPSSPLYNPYLNPTSQAVTELSKLGFDMSGGINNAWLAKNSWLKSYYRTGTSGTPLAPSSDSTPENDAAYWYYKALSAEENTQKAEREWAALQEELSYWAWRPDRNYSDEEVLAKVDWSNYPTLVKMDEGLATGVPLSLNRGVDYSQDALHGVIWAARNNGGTGSRMIDSVSHVLKHGNTWVKNEEIASRLDPSSDRYNPYMVGSTVDEAALYFGVAGFDSTWLEEYKALRGSDDLTAKRLYEQVYDAEQRTQKAEAELAQLEQDINQYLSVTHDADRILGYIDMADYPTLKKMDESLQSGDLLALNRAVGYDWKDIEAEIRRICTPEPLALPKRGSAAVAAALGVQDDTTEAYLAIRDAKNANLDRAGLDMLQAGTEAEKIVFQTARDSGFANSSQAMYLAILSGNSTPDTAYQDGLAAADRYAGVNYIKALEGIRPYEKAVDDKAKAEAEMAALLQEKPWLALFTESPVKPNGTSTTDIVSAYASQHGSNAMYDIWRKVDSLVNGTPFQEGYVGYADLGESEWERMEAQFNAIDWSEGLAAYELQQSIANLDTQIADLRQSYDDGIALAQDVQFRFANADRVADTFGGKRREGYDTTALLDFAYQYGAEYNPTDWSAYTLYDAALTEGYAYEQVAQAAKAGAEQYRAYLDDLNTVLSELDARGAMPEGDYRKNLEHEVALAERNLKDAEYFLIREAEDFSQVVEETRKKVIDAWSGFSLLPATVRRKGYSETDLLMADIDALHSAIINADDRGAVPWQAEMTETEKDTYLYLLGHEGADAAEEYFDYLKDDAYGVLHTRYSQRMSGAAQRMAEGGWLGDTGATILTVIMSPFKLVGSAYTGIAKLKGEEINPYNAAFATDILVGETRGEIKQDITDNFGEGTAANFFANLGYDAATGAGDSAMNALLFNQAGAVMMGLGAIGGEARDVKLRGGDDDQAIKMGCIAAGAEILSEAASNAKMLKMFKEPPANAKELLLNLVWEAGIEGVSEAASEAITSVADSQIMDELSNFNIAVQKYMDEGLSQEEAEQRATLDVVGNILYAGAVGSISSSATTLGSAGAGKLAHGAKNRGKAQMNEAPGTPASSTVTASQTQTEDDSAASAEDVEATPERTGARRMPITAEQMLAEDSETEAVSVAINPTAATSATSTEDGPRRGLFRWRNRSKPSTVDSLIKEGRFVEALQEARRLNGLEVSDDPISRGKVRMPITADTVADTGTETAAPAEDDGPYLGTLPAKKAAEPVNTDNTAAQDAPADTAETASPSAVSPDDPISRGKVRMPITAEQIQTSSNAVEALTLANRMIDEGTADEATRTAVIAASLALATTDGVSAGITAAAEAASHRYGGEAFAHTLAEVITEAVANSLPVDDVLAAVTVASLVDGAGRSALDSIVTGYPDAAQLSDLVIGAAIDMESRLGEAAVAETDSMVANRVAALIADGGLTGLQSYDSAVAQAQENLTNAQNNLQQAQQQLETTGQNLATVSGQYLADPSNAAMRGAVQQATKDVESANIVRQQMEQSVNKYDTQLQEAKATRDAVLDTTLTQLREQARADVEQLQEAARQQQEQSRIDAENQRLVDNVNAMEAESFIADNGYDQLSDEQRQQVYDTVSSTAQPVDVSRANVEFAAKVSRRFGVAIRFADDADIMGAYDPKQGMIILNRNATQGDIIRKVMAHELTHRAESSSHYAELADALLQLRYGDDTQARQADLNAIKAQYAGVYDTDADFESELVANAAEVILGNEEALNRLVAEKPSVARRILDALKSFINKMRGVNDPALDSLRRAEKLLEKSLDEVKGKAIRDFGSDGIKYALRTKEPPKSVVYAYKAFYARDGKLYPPMVSNITNDSDKQKVSKATSGTMKSLPTPVGVWLDADIGGILVDDNGKPVRTSETGRLRVKNDKGGGKDSSLAFRPGWHLGEWPDAKQFNKGPLTEYTTQEGEVKRRRMLMPDDIVFAKCEVSADEDYQLDAISYGVSDKGTFNRSQAGLPYVPEDGYYKYRTNPDPTTAPWLIAGSIRVTEILDDDDCARICAQFGVTPDKRVSGKKINLEDFGLKRGPVEATTEGMERFLENDANRANKKLLEESLTDPDYADAYVAREINFADPNIVKEFQMNGQDADAYQQTYTEKGLMKDRHGLKYRLKTNPAKDDAQQYSYDYLTSQPDMAVSKMPDQSIYAKGTGANRAKAKEDGIRNTQSTPGAVTYQSRLFVENLYTGKPIQINSQSIQHGILGSAERQRRNAAAGSIIGDLTRNAIPVNELIHAKKETQPWVEREHLFLSLAEDDTFYYPVAVVVQTSADDLGIVTHMEALEGVGKQYVYSLNAKQHKKRAGYEVKTAQGGGTSTDSTGTGYEDMTVKNGSTSTDSTISISDLLDLVKDDFADGFSADVLAHLGMQRPEGQFSGGTKYAKSDVTLPSIQGGLEAQVQTWRNPPEAQQGSQPNRAERQFASQTAQNSQAMPEDLRRELLENDEQHYYETDSNRAQLDRAWEQYQREGFEACRDRILQAEHLTTDDIAMANLLMALAFRSGDVNSAMELAHRYNTEGTAQGQALQARKLFSRMTPTGARAWVAGESEAQLAEHMRTHKRQRKQIDAEAKKVENEIQDKQGGDEIARLNAAREFTIDETNNRWGIPINEQQQALIDQYKLNNVRRPGVFYNRATTKQRMLEAILATPNPLELTGNGLNLIQRLEYLKAGEAVITNADLDYIGMHLSAFAASDVDTQGSREGDLHLSRAYEAYGNITPATGREKARTWRYTSMLLSVPSALRNVMGNAMQNTVNATANGIAVELDRIISKVTGERTKAHLSAAERVAGWQGFVEETQNTFRDFFLDKSITRNGEDRYNLNQRGRVFQSGMPEALRLVEGYLMSVGDRNFWKKAYINSMSEQQRVAKQNGTELNYEDAVERATAEANYATFNESNAVRDALGMLKRVPVVGDVLDFIMPFTGVPTNIVKRMWQYSPMGLATAAIKHGWRGVTGKDFNQLDFVNGMARGLTGTALFAVGMALGSLGFIQLGTGDEDDDKMYGVESAQGKQYAPYIRIGDEYISLSAFAPAVSPFIAGAAAFDIFKEDEGHFQALFNASAAMLDQILDASYMSNLKDIFGGYGSTAENLGITMMSSAISQNVPSVVSQLATALDPYVRDTKDKNVLIQTLNAGLIQKIPGLRETLPEKVDVAGRSVESKEGLRNFFDPLTTSNAIDDPALNELERLYGELGTSAGFPSDALSGTKTSLSGVLGAVEGEDKETYKKRYGELWRLGGETFDKDGNRVIITGVTDLIQTPAYQAMNDKEKAEAISGIVKSAKEGAAYEMGEKLGHVVDSASSSSSYSRQPVRAMPTQFAGSSSPMIQQLSQWYEQTGDGAFIPKGIGRSFSRNKVAYNLNDAEYAELWGLYEIELDRTLAGVDWTASAEEVAQAVESAYSSAASTAKTKFVKTH